MSNTSRNLGISFSLSQKRVHSHDGHGVGIRKTVIASVVLSASLFAMPSAFAGPAVNALPTGGQVAAGAATISQSGNVMNINQSTQRAVINWDSFNVGKNATVNFNQPNSSASTLNRVNGASQSMINGAVNANGQVIFVNPNGVVFGKGAEVNTGGLVATTMNIKDADYLSGKNNYSGGESGKVINKGNITANGINGYIALMAPEVKNQGVLIANIANSNTIALISGTKVTLSFNGSQLTDITVDASAINSLISNKKAIQTEGGQIIIAANAASNLKASVINNTGTISADTVSTVGGKVFLTAGTVNQSGTVSANSAQSDGGNITISGNQVNLDTSSTTTATGATAGGQILLGKTTKNTAQSQVNANAVTVAKGALVDASATQNGNGGSIEVWSTISTSVAGMFRANGGAIAGNGGTIDTSSAGQVTYGKGLVVNTTASKGKTGNWLTDPLKIIIDSTAATLLSNALNTTNVTLDATASSCVGIGNCTTSSTPLIHFLSGTSVYSSAETALTLNAPGGTITMDGSIAVGQVYAVAQTININGSLNTTSGSNGSIYLAGAIINILSNINSNGNSSNNSSSSNLTSANTITANNRRNGVNGFNSGLNADTNTYTSNGGAINIIASGNINIGSSTISSDTNNTTYISANGQSGGTINIVSVNGNINNQGIVDALGKTSLGGTVIIAAKNTNTFTGALISSDGYTQAGVIQIGVANSIGSGSTLAPPSINSQVATLLAAVNFTPSSSSSPNSGNILSSNTALDSTSLITANAAASTSQVVLNSQAGQIYIAGNNSLNTAATIQANADTGGLIILSSPAGIYQNTGYIQTNGGAGLGGTIAQSGLISTNLISATAEANGTLGGGNIILGRDFKTNPLSGSATQDALLPNLSSVIAVPTSASTTVDANSSLSANSKVGGDGGNVLVWGNSNTVAGTLSAQALGTTGNGGFIETSGDTLSISTSASVSAASIKGIAGTWLLDPYDLTVASSGGDVTGAAIQSALGSSNVTIQTNTASVTCTNVSCAAGTSNLGDIYINDAITWSSANTLSLKSYNNIYVGTSTIGGSLTLTGTANIVLVACGGNSTCYASAAYSSPTSGVGLVLMGMAGSPTSGLLTNQNGFNGQILINSTGVTPSGSSPISINGRNYTVINSESAFTAISGSSNYVLGSDLTFTTSYSTAPVAGANNTSGFNGNLNGLGHKVSGLSITDSSTTNYDGLIGLMKQGSLSNIGVSGTISTSTRYTAGGLVGKMASDNGAVSLYNSYSSVGISLTAASATSIGGLVGQLGGATVSNVYATGNIIGNVASLTRVGGLIGLAYANSNTNSITNAFATGTVTVGNSASLIGGLIGDYGLSSSSGASPTTLTNAYATGNVTAGTNSSNIGGLIGFDWGNKTNYVYSSGTVTAGSGSAGVGALAGYSATSSATGNYLSNSFYDSTKNINNYSGFGSFGGGGAAPAGLTTTQLSYSTNLTFTFSSSAWGFSAVSNAPPVLCNFGGCSSYTHYVASDTYIGTSGGTWSTGTWSLGYAPTSSNTGSIGSIVIPTGITIIFDTGNVGSLGNAISNAGTISFSGSSNVTLSGAISGNGALNTASSYTGKVTLSGTNSYSGGTTISAGTLVASTSSSALGSGTVTLGASSGSANATLQVATTGLTYSNPIVLSSGTSGTLTIGNTGTASTTFSGGVTGTNNLVISEGASSGTITFATGSLNNTGTITNSGSGTGTTTISAAVGSNVTGITESSSTSALTISGAITPNTSGTTFTNSGTASLTLSGGITGTGNIIFNNNSSGTTTVSTTSINNAGTITNSGSGTGTTTISAAVGSNVTGITESSSTSPLTLSGSNSYTGGTTITAGTINAGSGNALGTGAVGIGSSGILNLTYSGTVTLGSTLSMSTGASITNSANTANLYITGTSTLNGSIATTGTQTYTGAVTLGANAALTSTNSNITFSSTVDSAAGSYYGLSITNGTGTTAFGGIVGSSSGTSALGYLCINSTGCSASAVGFTTGSGTTTLAGNVTTSGNQTYGGNLTLGANTALTSTANSGNGVVTIAGAVNSGTSIGSGILEFLGSGYWEVSTNSGSTWAYYLSNGSSSTYQSSITISGTIFTSTASALLSPPTITYASSTYSWTPSASATISYLVVGGGGGGGQFAGGGGGGGGVLQNSTSVTSSTYSISIGGGGIGSSQGSTSAGSNGSNSSIIGTGVSVTASGGGGGGTGSGSNGNGLPGGSGGGSSWSPFVGGAGLAGQGNSGGSSTGSLAQKAGSSDGVGGGGGGSGDNNGGAGGAGATNLITGSNIGQLSGVIRYIAGGGAGSSIDGASVSASGGLGGGGTGGLGSSGGGTTAGTANTGGGGGGTWNGGNGGNGGSGVVVISGAIAYTQGTYSLTINSGTGKASIGGSVFNVTTLTINSTATNSAVSGSIGGSTAVAYNTGSGYTGSNGAAGVLRLAGTNTYTGGTTITGGTLQAGSTTAFGGAASAITVNSGAALDLNGKTLANANALTLNGTGISNDGALTNSSATGGTYIGAITLGSDSLIGSTAGAITVTGAIGSTASAYNLALVGSKAITLSSATNVLSTIASSSGANNTPGDLSITNNQALTIGSMTIGGTTYSGLSSIGTILVKTITGNLTVNNAVTTTSTSSSTSTPAIKLAAGFNDATSSTTNNIVLGSSSSSLITAGSGAIISLYSGSPLSSTNLSAFAAGQATSNINYGVTATTGSLASGAGYYALYRSTQPNLYVIYGSSDASTYGSAPTITYTFNTLANGTGTSYLSSDTATVNATGTALFKGTNFTTSTTNVSLNSSANAGSYTTVTYLSGLSSPIYALSAGSNTGALTISKANAFVTISSGQSSTYGATPTINYTFNANSAGTGSTISASPAGLSGTATITNAPTSSSDAGTYSLTYASGLSSTNYAFNAAASSRSYTVSPAVLNLTTSKVYDGTTAFTNANTYTLSGTRYNGDAMPTIASGSAATSSANAASYTSFASNGLTLSNTNYTLTGGTLAATIDKASIGIIVSGVYSGSTTITPVTYTITGLVSVSGTPQTLVPTSVTVSNANVSSNGENYVTAILSKTGTATLSNYSINTSYNGTSGTNTTNAVTLTGAPLGLTVTGTYNGLYSMTPSSVTPIGLLNGQTLTGLSSVTLSSKDVASNGVNYVISASGVTGTANLINYAITAAYNNASTSTQNVATLSAAPLGITVTGSYSGSTVIAPSSVTATGLVNSETLTGLISATLNNANVSANGSNYVTAISGPSGTATLSNYSITTAYNASSGSSQNTATINAAVLTVSAVASQKFVTESDPTGYGGVIYSGWVAGQGTSVLNTTGLTISRSNPTVNTAGSNYTLTPGGLAANGGNYTFSYQTAGFTIVPADTLAVVVTNASTNYGTAPTYSITSARYLNSGNNTIYTLTPSVSGSIVSMSDGSGGSVTFTLTPVSSTGASTITSGSGNYKVDSYTLSATNKTIVSNNFSNSITVTGALTVSSLGVNPSNITVTGLSKTYDGTTNATGLTLNASSASFKTNDVVSVTGSGNFADTNVGTGKAITITPVLTGADAANYYLTGNGTISTTGTITQLSSVTYTGTSGGNWSNSANWAGGAIPTLSNVATVVIPTTKTVVYDAANLTSLTPTSAITGNGTLSFTGSSATTFANTVSGTGSISQSGTGALTLTGTNTYSGGTSLASGSSLIVGSSSALGTGALTSSGGTLSTAGVTLSSLTVNGAVILASDITSSGNQTYNGAVTLNNSANSTTLSSSAGNITFGSTLNAGASNQSLVLSATAGQVTFNGQVGVATQTYNTGTQSYSPTTYSSYQSQSSNNLANLTVSANTINLNADISTRLTQTYTGSLLVGDNGSNGPTRVLLSEDPAITFNGTINDTVAGTHNLFVKAVTIINEAPSIIFNGIVGGTAALKSLTASTGAQDTATGALYSAIDTTPANLVGTITIKENISTTGDQTYTANGFTLGNGTTNQTLDLTTQSGNIAFNSGSGLGSGFTQGGSGLIVGLTTGGGSVSGLSGSGLNYHVTDTTASNSSSSSTSSSSASSSLANVLANNLAQQIYFSDPLYASSSMDGNVSVGQPILCNSTDLTQSCTN